MSLMSVSFLELYFLKCLFVLKNVFTYDLKICLGRYDRIFLKQNYVEGLIKKIFIGTEVFFSNFNFSFLLILTFKSIGNQKHRNATFSW